VSNRPMGLIIKRNPVTKTLSGPVEANFSEIREEQLRRCYNLHGKVSENLVRTFKRQSVLYNVTKSATTSHFLYRIYEACEIYLHGNLSELRMESFTLEVESLLRAVAGVDKLLKSEVCESVLNEIYLNFDQDQDEPVELPFEFIIEFLEIFILTCPFHNLHISSMDRKYIGRLLYFLESFVFGLSTIIATSFGEQHERLGKPVKSFAEFQRKINFLFSIFSRGLEDAKNVKKKKGITSVHHYGGLFSALFSKNLGREVNKEKVVAICISLELERVFQGRFKIAIKNSNLRETNLTRVPHKRSILKSLIKALGFNLPVDIDEEEQFFADVKTAIERVIPAKKLKKDRENSH